MTFIFHCFGCRSLVAAEAKIGRPRMESGHNWPALSFGWTLSDVLKNRPAPAAQPAPPPPVINKSTVNGRASNKKLDEVAIDDDEEEEVEDEMGSLTDKVISNDSCSSR